MNKKLNLIMNIIFSMAIVIFALTRYHDFNHENEIYHEYIKNLKSSIKQEYKTRLKDSVESTISFIRATNHKITKNHFKLLKEEIIRITLLIDENEKRDVDEFIEKYRHKLISISTVKNDAKVQGRIVYFKQQLYLSIEDEILKNKLVDEVREYLYNEIIDDNRYTWINKIRNYDGGNAYATRLIHPNLKQTEGKVLSTNTEDIKGNKPYLVELNGIKKDKEICFEYYFKKLNSNDISKKLSYSKLYEKEDWIVATGIHLDNMNYEIEKRIQPSIKAHIHHSNQTLVYESASTILFILLFFLLKRIIQKYFNENQKLKDKLEIKLQVSENRANGFFNLPINLHLILTLEGKILHVNDSSKRILGYEGKELLGTALFDLLHPNDMKKTIEERKKVKAGEDTIYFENRYKHKNGATVYLAWSAMIDIENNVIYGSAHDITESKLIQIEKERQEMIMYKQSKMAAMGEMIENIAHQWKQPLSVIAAVNAGIKMKSELDILEKKDVLKATGLISESVQHSVETIDDFRNFFKQDKHYRNFNISETFSKIFRLLISQFTPPGITVVKQIEPVLVHGLENELIHVLINTLNNAKDELVKAVQKEKIIFIEVKKVENSLEIKVRDNAGGVQEDVLKTIFDAHVTTKNENEGTGIGLYMSRMIIEEHMNGKIKVENLDFEYDKEHYKGAEFTILVPLKL